MVIADLKKIEFNGIASKLEAQLIICEQQYRIPLCLLIGEKGRERADYFYVDVMNIEYVRKHKIVIGSKSFIVDDIDDIDDIEKEIKFFVNSIYGEDLDTVLNQLRYYFDWEYENLKLVS